MLLPACLSCLLHLSQMLGRYVTASQDTFCLAAQQEWSVTKPCSEAAIVGIFITQTWIIQNTDRRSPTVNTHGTAFGHVNCTWLLCCPWVPCDLDSTASSSAARRRRGSTTLGCVRGRNRQDAKQWEWETEKCLRPRWMDFMKRRWRRMSQWYFGFITFLEKHTYTYTVTYFYIIYWPEAKFYLVFYFSPN